jgi:exopolyphosphatase/guanosine-5'-triphosphate,3'-diphosphate pyrophosphatase
MVICEADQDGTLKVIDKEKEMVRLRGGLDRLGRLDPIIEERALECLKRFGDRLRHFKAENVRVAGTNTIRNLRPPDEFIRQGSKLLGHKIEVISGREEARLVYLGVSHTLSNDHGKQLVIDIGGGSTEFIIGTRFIPNDLESLEIGAASSTKRFFADGRFTEEAWKKAVVGLRLEILPIQAAFSKENWLRATGSSGTIKTTHKIIIALGLEPFGITLNALYSIRDRMIEAGSTENLDFPGLGQDRVPVFAGGLAVLIAAFEALNIDHMTVSDGALREGLLYDMLGRIRHEDVRDRSVDELVTRFKADEKQAAQVMKRSIDLFDQIVDEWNLPEGSRELLAWASLLHEIGLSITHNKHHFQGAYILKYAFMPGFSRREQIWLATLVKNHRRKVDWERFEDIPDSDRVAVVRLSIILRLAVLLHRRRDSQRFDVKISVSESKVELLLPDEFEGHALLKADLLREKNWLAKIDYKLSCF